MERQVFMQTIQNPMPLRGMVCNDGEKKFETIIQGKKITASFSADPDENILKLVKKILIDSHTNKMTKTIMTET